MLIRPTNKIFFIIFLLFCTCFFFDCSNAIITETFPEAGGALQRSINKPMLSELSEDQCIDFIIQQNISIPPQYADLPNLGTFIKSIIQAVENDPNYPLTMNYSILYNFVNSIVEAVNNYYGASRGNSYMQMPRNTRYTLQYNEVMTSSGQWGNINGVWDNSYPNFNCYSYSIEKTDS